MRIRLSSRTTFVGKAIAMLGTFGFAFATLAMFLKLGPVKPPASGLDDGKWVFLVATIAIVSGNHLNFRLKEVWMDEEALYISNIAREVRVELRSVESVQIIR